MKNQSGKVAIRLLKMVKPYWVPVLAAIICASVFALSSGATIGMLLPVFDDVFTRTDENNTMENIGEYTGDNLFTLLDRNISLHGKAFLDELLSLNPSGMFQSAKALFSSLRESLRLVPASQALIAIISTIILLILIKNFASFMQAFFMSRVEQGVLYDVRKMMYRHLLHLDLVYFARSRSGELLSRFTADVDRLKGAITESLINMLKQGSLLLVYLSIAIWASWHLALLVLIIFPPSLVILLVIGRKLRKKSHSSQERMADFASIIQETTLGIRVVKAFSMETFEMNRFGKILKSHKNLEITLHRLRAISGPLTEVVGALVSGILFWYGGKAVLSGNGMSPGQFFVFLGAALSMMDPVKNISKANARIQSGLAAAERVFRIMDTGSSVMDVENPVELDDFRDRIVYDDVSFSYINHKPVLQHINMELKKSEMIALVGPSGAGKSTLADLLPRFYDPDSGKISIDGIDLRKIKISSLRRLMGIVTQETVLFNDTVFNNIAYGESGIPFEKIREAAEVANALEFIEDLEDSFQTVIGERGITLSGGQRQRLAIARAILKDPKILIFDEATSSLDTEAEQLVQQAINNLVQGRTTLVIAHRLSTVRKADRVLVIDNGRIVEQGSHDDLITLNGLYRRLYDLQFSDKP